MLKVVERADKDKDHFLVEARDVVPDHEDDGSELTSDRDGVLGIHLLILVRHAWGHQIPVDDSWLDAAGKFNEDLTIGKCRVCEAG